MRYKMKDTGYYTELAYGRLDVSGDETAGFRPFQLLVSSVAVCSAGVFRKILEKKRISYGEVDVAAEVTRNEANVNEVTAIALHFTISGASASQETVEKALALSTKNCPIVQSVNGSIDITETIEFI
nr:OsmC family protein [Shouchella shacheensis]